MARLENKVVLLSGGASGIGAATAHLIVREGGKAVLADRDEARGRTLAEDLVSRQTKCSLYDHFHSVFSEPLSVAPILIGGIKFRLWQT